MNNSGVWKDVTSAAYNEGETPDISTGRAILLVEADDAVRLSRSLLLSKVNAVVEDVAGYCDLCRISPARAFLLAVVSLRPSQEEAAKITAHIRRNWPSAKILLLGELVDVFDDPLYDEILESRFHPAALITLAKHLWTQRVQQSNCSGHF